MSLSIEHGTKLTTFVQQLEWREEDGILTVTPSDEARFAVKLNRAIDILRQAAKADIFQAQIRLLIDELANWLSRQSKVAAAFVTIRDGVLCLVVMRTEVALDEAFEDELSALDIAIANDKDLDLLKLTSLSLPLASEEAIASFLDPDFTLQLHGDRSGSHRTGE